MNHACVRRVTCVCMCVFVCVYILSEVERILASSGAYACLFWFRARRIIIRHGIQNAMIKQPLDSRGFARAWKSTSEISPRKERCRKRFRLLPRRSAEAKSQSRRAQRALAIYRDTNEKRKERGDLLDLLIRSKLAVMIKGGDKVIKNRTFN